MLAPPEGGEYFVAIERFVGAAPRLDLFLDGPGFDQYRVAAGSIVEPASAPEVLATAAICWNGGALEPYSSQGPTVDGRVKPDVAGFDSNASAMYGPFDSGSGCGESGFTGTSAAAPHVAGVAAILLQQHAPLSAAQLQARLEASAEDLGAAGKDSVYGWGRLRLPVGPDATTHVSRDVGRRVATLRGFVTPNRWPGTYRWEYSTDPTFATFTSTASTAFAAGSAVTTVSFLVDGLEPTTTYHARFVTENAHGSATGSSTTFTTVASAKPYVSTSAATAVTPQSATLHGVVNPNGLATNYRFWYGTSIPAATGTPEVTLAGDSSVPVSVDLAGLTAGRVYYYRLVATNSAGTEELNGTFATAAAPSPPAPPAPPPSGGGGSAGGGPDIEVGLAASTQTPAPNDVIEVRATVFNRSPDLAARGLRAAIVLPAGAVLLAPPAADTGSGCVGTVTLDCFLDYLSPNRPTQVRFAINVGPAGAKAITVQASMTVVDPNLANNAGTLALDVRGATEAPTAPAPVAGPSGKTVNGTSGRNTLRGTPQADTLRGFGGDDRLFGGAGNDRLDGGSGRDLLDAGSGNDVVAARDKSVDTIRCGAGRDVVVADRKDRVAKGCETVRRR